MKDRKVSVKFYKGKYNFCLEHEGITRKYGGFFLFTLTQGEAEIVYAILQKQLRRRKKNETDRRSDEICTAKDR